MFNNDADIDQFLNAVKDRGLPNDDHAIVADFGQCKLADRPKVTRALRRTGRSIAGTKKSVCFKLKIASNRCGATKSEHLKIGRASNPLPPASPQKQSWRTHHQYINC
ncbi:hypothetical protein Q9L58_010770 [Maublancomyces gigas]|uniref:Uncharacterized protein n=1 Tax=Discina gigas TaxID=1032678 RepID=A0ABR3G3I7_9PEZI